LVFQGILYRNGEENRKFKEEQPEFFPDLNLDQVIKSIGERKKDYNLETIFYTSLRNNSEVSFRQNVFRDLQNENILNIITIFSENMKKINKYLSEMNDLYMYQKERCLLDSVEVYFAAVEKLTTDLEKESPESDGLANFAEYILTYTHSERFLKLKDETVDLRTKLDAVKFTMTIKNEKITVSKYCGEEDYSAEIRESFKKFSDNSSKVKPVMIPQSYGMNHVEAAILELVAKIYPETFQNLLEYYKRNIDFMDPTIKKFQRDIQFYLAYLEHISWLKVTGLQFCMPTTSEESKNVYCNNGFDIGLAEKLAKEKKKVVTNDFELNDDERIIVVTGPNHGGKTTFARMFGQIHYLASLGLPVPGSRANLFLFDNILTHFERAESLENHRGKLEDDLFRIKSIMDRSTSNTIIIINEMLSSTTLLDAVTLGKKIVAMIRDRGCICLYVTFLDELTSLEATLSMVSTIVPENPEERTYKILKRKADGLAYAIALARKYSVTYEDIKKRILS
jgi:DNA mismatch repair ATPase MutS